jgi:predicted anti-sigma-YlaC factor YlaD
MKDKNCRTCQVILDKLNAYMDGDLSDIDCKEIETHLATCENCQIVLHTLEKTIYLYRKEREAIKLPEDAKQRLFTCLGLNEDAAD